MNDRLRSYAIKLLECINLAVVGVCVYLYTGLVSQIIKKDISEFIITALSFLLLSFHSVFIFWVLQVKFPSGYLTKSQLFVHYTTTVLATLISVCFLGISLMFTFVNDNQPATNTVIQLYETIGSLCGIIAIVKAVSTYLFFGLVLRLQKNYRFDL